MKEKIDDWPADFQQLFSDLLDQRECERTTDFVETYEACLNDHLDEWHETISCWNNRDWERARDLLEALQAGEQLPPLIVEGGVGGLLVDGYHRMCALKLMGCHVFRAIDLQAFVESCEELV